MQSISFRKIYKLPLYEGGKKLGLLVNMGFDLPSANLQCVEVSKGWFPMFPRKIMGNLSFHPTREGALHLEKKKPQSASVFPLSMPVYTRSGIFLGRVKDLFLSSDLVSLLQIYVAPRLYGPTYLIHRQQIIGVVGRRLLVRDELLDIKETFDVSIDSLRSLSKVSMIKEK